MIIIKDYDVNMYAKFLSKYQSVNENLTLKLRIYTVNQEKGFIYFLNYQYRLKIWPV